MIIFNVVKQRRGWAITMDGCMTAPFRSKDAAIHEANCLADSIRRHGECARVIIETAATNEPPAERSIA